MTRIGLVTGMRVEEKCLDPALATLPPDSRPLTFCAGASAERAYRGAQVLIKDGAAALLSIGIAGGLDAALHPGSIVLPDIVIGPEHTQYSTSADWHAAVTREIPSLVIGTLVASATPACTATQKAALHATSGALAVDMESGAVAAAAAEAKVPFLALRVIADPANRAVPPAAMYGIAPDGRSRPLAVLGQLFLRPIDLPALISLARDSQAALRQLRRVALLGTALFRPPIA